MERTANRNLLKEKSGWCGLFARSFSSSSASHTTHIDPCYPNTNCWCSFNGTEKVSCRVTHKGKKLSAFQQTKLFATFPSQNLLFKLHSTTCSKSSTSSKWIPTLYFTIKSQHNTNISHVTTLSRYCLQLDC